MQSCHEYSEQLLDYLYDLLELAAMDGLRAHLNDCSACRGQLDHVQNQQELLAKAARVYHSVPEFTPPVTIPSELVTDPSLADTIVQDAETVVKMPEQRPQISLRRRLWPWLVVAATVLALVSAGVGLYKHGWNERQRAFAAAEKDVKEIDTLWVNLQRKAETKKQDLPVNLSKQRVHLHAYGCALYQTGVENTVRVRTQNLQGDALPSDVSLRAFTQKQQKPFFECKQQCVNGQTALALPGNWRVPAGEKVRVEIAASSHDTTAKVEQVLEVARPAYRTHIATNKPAYQVGDLLFFRTLTLERFKLQPPEKELRLCYSLVDTDGRKVKHLIGTTKKNGIGGGEFALTNDLPDGSYTLLVEECQVASSDGDHVVEPQSFQFVLRRPDAPGLALDRAQYFLGDMIRGNYRARILGDGQSLANQPVTVTLRAPQNELDTNNARRSLLKTYQTHTDNDGNIRFAIPVPKRTAPGKAELKVQLHDGWLDESVSQAVAVLQPWKVDFYPEGGQFVSGVSNRMYFRVTAPAEQSGPLVARLVADKQQPREVSLTATTARPHLHTFTGSFCVTPYVGQNYRLQVYVNRHLQIEQPLPKAQDDGLALEVLNSVAKEATPIRCRLLPTRDEKDLLVVASCRGHVVDQRFVTAHRKGTEVELQARAGVRGVVRLTVYEPQPQQLTPRAERLLFRRPAKALQLTTEASPPQHFNYRPGQKATLRICSQSEKGKKIPTWLTANVVEAEACQLEPNPTRGLPDFFFGSSVSEPADLEDAQIALAEVKKSEEALDRFLAIAGWRRFVTAKVPAQSKQQTQKSKQQPASLPPLFSRDNRHALERQYQQELAGQLAALTTNLEVQHQNLQKQKEDKIRQARIALTALTDYEKLPRQYLGMALGVLVVTLLLSGVLLVSMGLVRMLRQRTATPMLAAAFAAFVLCFCMYAGTDALRSWSFGTWSGTERDENWARATLTAPMPRRGHDQVLGQVALAKTVPTFDALAQFAGTRVGDENAAGSPLRERLPHKFRPQSSVVFVTANLQQQELFLQNHNRTWRAQPGRRFQMAQQRQETVGNMLSIMNNAKIGPDGLPKDSGPGENDFPPGFFPDPTNQKSGGGAGQKMTNPVEPSRQGGTSSQPPATIPTSPKKVTEKDGQSSTPTKKNSAPGQTSPNFGGRPKGGSKNDAYTYFYRQYANVNDFRNHNNMRNLAAQGTLLWSPNIFLQNGTGEVRFDLPHRDQTYRVFLYGHSSSGRLGYYEGTLEVRSRK